MDYDWMAARLAEMFPNMHRDAGVERELFDCVLTMAKRDFGRAVQLVLEMQGPGKERPVQVIPAPPPPPPVPQRNVLLFFSLFVETHLWQQAVTLHIPRYWRKYWWSRAQGVYDVEIRDAESVLFDRDTTFLPLTEAEGFAELDRRMGILFPRKDYAVGRPGGTNSKPKKNKKNKWVASTTNARPWSNAATYK